MSKPRIILLAFLTVLLFTSSCSMLNEKKQAVFFLTFHQFVPSPEQIGGGLVMPVKSPDETVTRYVRTIPLLSSAYIYKGEVVPSKDKRKCGLRLFFDQHSQGMLQEACFYNKGRDIAIIMDGFLAGYSKLPGNHLDEGYVETAPIWNPMEAAAIVNHIEQNYGLSK